MKQQRRVVGRRRKLRMMAVLICLFFNLASVSAVRVTNLPSRIRKDTANENGKSKQETSLDKSLVRKSRELPNTYNERNIYKTNQKVHPEHSEINVEVEMENFGFEQSKRNKATFIPILRPGRSQRFDVNSIVPFPDSMVLPYTIKNQENSNESGELLYEDTPLSNVRLYQELFEKNDGSTLNDFKTDDSEENSHESLQSFEINSKSNVLNSVNERQVENNGTVIPYPRLGKRDVTKFSTEKAKRSSESLIPQLRYGRSVLTEKLSKTQKQPFYILPNYRPGRSFNKQGFTFTVDKKSKQGLLPYPRPGRSDVSNDNHQNYMLPVPRFGRSIPENEQFEKDNIELLLQLTQAFQGDKLREIQEDTLKSKDLPIFLIPYPRPGKRFFGTKPLPPNVKVENKGKDHTLQDMKEVEDKESSSTIFLVPYPRPGRSFSGKDDTESHSSYLRFQKSVPNSMVPYPRLGRSSNENNQYYILPYPRAGRSQSNISLIPYARVGRSSNNLLPYPRFGRAHTSVLPYPRLGRSSNKLYKSGISTYVLPYPRVGRRATSSSIIPQLRVGKSFQIQDNPKDNMHSEINYSQSGSVKEDLYGIEMETSRNDKTITGEDEHISSDSEKFKSALLVPAKKLHKHMLTSDTTYMLPYPRPGRFV